MVASTACVWYWVPQDHEEEEEEPRKGWHAMWLLSLDGKVRAAREVLRVATCTVLVAASLGVAAYVVFHPTEERRIAAENVTLRCQDGTEETLVLEGYYLSHEANPLLEGVAASSGGRDAFFVYRWERSVWQSLAKQYEERTRDRESSNTVQPIHY